MTEEKRAFQRLSKNGLVHVDVTQISNEELDSLVRFEGVMKDISELGIRLHGKHPLSKGAKLDLRVQIDSNDSKYNLQGAVKWVSETTEHEFVAGLEIDFNSQDFKAWQKSFH